MNSPASRSLAKLRKEGWLCAMVEHWNAFARRRVDLFGFIDIIAVKGDLVMAVQTTSGANVADRVQKIRECQAADTWLESPCRIIMVHGWALRGARGERKLWTCREVRVERDGVHEVLPLFEPAPVPGLPF